MKRTVHYKHGYKIVITGRFYEVSDGKALTHFGELRHHPTLQEVWNKTIGLEQQEEKSETNYYRNHYCSSFDYLHVEREGYFIGKREYYI